MSQLESMDLTQAALTMQRCEDIKLKISDAINFGTGTISSCHEEFPATYRY